MRKILALLLALIVSPSLAQVGQLAPGKVIGNGTSGQALPAPFDIASILLQWGVPLPGTVGGTNNAFMQFTGPATTLKTYTLPNASDTIATLTAFQTLTNKTITGLPTPVSPSDAATKSYVDSNASGLTILAPSRLATAAVLPNTPTYANGSSGVGATLTAGANSTLTVDGTVANINDVVLVKKQSSGFQNGIYTVTNAGSGAAAWVLTRITYFDQAAEMKAGAYTLITAGSTNINSSFVLASTITTVGTDTLNFNVFSNGTGGLTVGATAISSGVTTKVLFENAGTLGEYTISGTGNVVMTTSPTITTPSVVFGTTAASTITATSGNTGFANTLTADNSGTSSNAGTTSSVKSSLSGGSNVFGQLIVGGGASPSAALNTGTGVTGGLSIASGAGPLTLASPNTTGKLTTAASTTGSAGFSCLQGSAPSSPTNGDVWCTSTGMFGRFNGTTIGPFGAGGGGGAVSSVVGLTGVIGGGAGIAASGSNIATTFTQAGTGGVATDLVTKIKQQPVTPWDFTSSTIDNGTTDATSAIQAALNTGKNVYLPKPTTCYLVSSDLSMVGQGQEIFGDGRGVPTICVKNNASFLLGLFICNGAQPGNGFRDMAVLYTQPNPTTGTVTAMRAQLTQYKPVWSCESSPRVSIRHMLVQGAWNGGDFIKNSGGLEVLDLQMSAFGYGISLDGALDTVRVTDFHFWPFGLTTNQAAVFQGTTGGSGPGVDYPVAILAGRVDGLYVSGLLNISWQGMYMFQGTQSGLAGPCLCYVSNSDFDSYNGIVQNAGYLFLSNTLFSHVSAAVSALGMAGSQTTAVLNNIHLSNNSTTTSIIMGSCTTCSLTVKGLFEQNGTSATNTIGIATSAVDSTVIIDDVYVDSFGAAQGFLLGLTPSSSVNNITASNITLNTTSGTAYSTPMFDIRTGNRVHLTGLRARDKGAGAGTFISKVGANFDYIAGNNAPGWTYSLPTGTPGYYPSSPINE